MSVSSSSSSLSSATVPTMLSTSMPGSLATPTPPVPTPPIIPTPAAAPTQATEPMSQEDIFKVSILAGPIIAAGVIVIGTALTISSLARLIFSLQYSTNVHYMQAEALQKDLELEQQREAKLKRDLELADKNINEMSIAALPKDSGNNHYFQLAIKIINGTLSSDDEDEVIADDDELGWIRGFKILMESYKKSLGENPIYLQKAKAHVLARAFTNSLSNLSGEQRETLAYQMAKKKLSDINERERQELRTKNVSSEEDEFTSWLEKDDKLFSEAEASRDWSCYKAFNSNTASSLDDEIDPLGSKRDEERKVRFDPVFSPESTSSRIQRARSRSIGGGSDPRASRSRSYVNITPLSGAARSLEEEFSTPSTEDLRTEEDLLKRSHEEQLARLEKDYAWELSALRQGPEALHLLKFQEAQHAVETSKRALAETSHRVQKLSVLLEKCKAYAKAKEELMIYFTAIFYGGTMGVPVAGPSVVMAYDNYSQQQLTRKRIMQKLNQSQATQQTPHNVA